MTSDIFGMMIPIGICVVLPIMVVWIESRAKINKDNKSAEILMKAIENNSTIDVEKFVEAFGNKKKTPVEILHLRLLRGCIFTFVGVALVITTIICVGLGRVHVDFIPFMTVATGIVLAIGLAYLVVYFVTRKTIEGDRES